MCEVEGNRDQESEKHLLLYIMDCFTWEHYSPELNDFGNAFGSKTVFVTRFCMAAALYFEVAWARGEKWIFPLIPDLLTESPMRHGGKLPIRPTCSTKRRGDNVKLRCREWWMYLLVLLQCWKDESCTFDYGGALRLDSKVMLFIYFRIKNLLKKAGVVDFHLYQIKSKTNWSVAMLTKYTPDQLTVQREIHREAKEEMTAFKDWMHKRYEAEATCEYNELQASGGNFDTLANHREDAIRRPGDKDQFHKERDLAQKRKGISSAPSGGLDAERQRRHQSESEERQDYSRRRDEEIRFREGGTPSPMTYDSNSPSGTTPGACTKKKITWAEYQCRPSSADREKIREREEAEWREKMEEQQRELEFRRSEVDRLKKEHDQLSAEQECLQAGQEQLACLRVEQDEQERRRAARRECRRCEYERADQECLAMQARDTAENRVSLGSHTPVQDEHGEDLDYIHDVEQEERNDAMWQRLIADAPINKELARIAQTHEQEAALLAGPTLAATLKEEEALLAAESQRPDLTDLLSGLQDLPESALSQLSQRIDEIRQKTPSSASPVKSSGPPPGLESTPQSTQMAQALLQVTTNLGQLPSGERPVTQAPGYEETKRATDLIEAELKAPGTPLQK